jgi:hypothetical protein
MVQLTVKQARRLALRAQLLTSPLPRNALTTIRHLGYVQIDTIHVIERAHHHTLWSRLPDYEPTMLAQLMANQNVFEYWAHAAAYLPLTDYRFHATKMGRFTEQSPWFKQTLKKYGDLMAGVKERIIKEGPLGSRDFSGTEKRETWSFKPARMALELLWQRGKIMVARRESFRRVYDLTERVLPDWVDTTPPGEDEVGRFILHRALTAHGVLTKREIRGHLWSKWHGALPLAKMIDSGEVIKVAINGLNEDHYALGEQLSGLPKRNPPRRLHLLNPFDNLLINRKRLAKLFDFDYALECYKPKTKRQFGHFVLPILWGSDFVGRLEVKAERKVGELRLIGLRWENAKKPDARLRQALDEKLAALAKFNKCNWEGLFPETTLL